MFVKERKQIGLAKQTIVTENTRRTASEVIKKYYGEKGYLNLKLEIQERPHPAESSNWSEDFSSTL